LGLIVTPKKVLKSVSRIDSRKPNIFHRNPKISQKITQNQKKKHRIRNPKYPSKSHKDSTKIPEPENCLPPSRPQEAVSLSPAEAETPAKTAFWSPGAEKSYYVNIYIHTHISIYIYI
jgi:hypothetical protein